MYKLKQLHLRYVPFIKQIKENKYYRNDSTIRNNICDTYIPKLNLNQIDFIDKI